MMDYMLVSLCDELVLVRYWELDLEFDDDFCGSTSRYVYTLCGFCCFGSNKESHLAIRVVPFIVLSKILFLVTV